MTTHHSLRREAELLAACHESYMRGLSTRMDDLHNAYYHQTPYTIDDLEHDIDLVLRGETPERCANWPYFSYE